MRKNLVYSIVIVSIILGVSGVVSAFAVCSVSIPAGPISFDISGVGLVHNGPASDEESLLLSNVGTETASVTTAATHWEDTQGTPMKRMDKGKTAVATFSNTYGTKTSLATPVVLTTDLLVDAEITAFYQLQVILDAGSEFFTGDLDQTILISFSC